MTTTTTAAPTTAPTADPSPELGRPKLVRAEFLRILTTNTWWLLAIGAFVLLALTFFLNAVGAHFLFTQPAPEGMSPTDQAAFEATRGVAAQAANLYTAGQF